MKPKKDCLIHRPTYERLIISNENMIYSKALFDRLVVGWQYSEGGWKQNEDSNSYTLDIINSSV